MTNTETHRKAEIGWNGLFDGAATELWELSVLFYIVEHGTRLIA